jgi:hypothetical protein
LVRVLSNQEKNNIVKGEGGVRVLEFITETHQLHQHFRSNWSYASYILLDQLIIRI